MSSILDEDKTWVERDFGLDKRLTKALSKLGYTYPTLVQAKSLPITLQGKDVLVKARTGSGKTVAFGLPVIHKLLSAKSSARDYKQCVFCVILAPTKELCKQIEKNITELIYYCKDIVSVVSIVDDNQTVISYKLQGKPDIIISTPAKLIQQLQSGKVDLGSTKTLVIDEADLVLSFGYAEEVQAITSKMPSVFQGLLMSATLSPELDKFKRVVLHNPAVLKLEESKQSGNLLQFYLQCTDRDKFLVLYVFLKLSLLQGKGIIFVNDIDRCYKLKLFLQQFYITSAVLNSEMPLNSRLHIIDEFNRGVFDYLIATDASIDTGNEDEEDDDDADNDSKEGEIEVNNDDSLHEDEDDDADINDEEDEDDVENGDDREDVEDGSDDEDVDEEEEEEEEDDGDDNDDNDENGDDETNKEEKKPSKQPKKMSREQIQGYGASRGLDFKGVTFVVNFDFPITSASYTHRIGRTARGGASGTALSFVSIAPPVSSSNNVTSYTQHELDLADRDAKILREVRSQQPRLGTVEGDNVLAVIGSVPVQDPLSVHATEEDERYLQPSPLVFNMKELDTFRYRVEDTLRSVTSASVHELRSAELKREILNSSKLKSYFAENPDEFKILRHDCAVAHPIRQKTHLRYVPDYLVPQSLKGVANSQGSRKRKRRNPSHGSSQSKINQSKERDPLRNPNAGDSSSSSAQPATKKLRTNADRIFTAGESKHLSGMLSGRKQWKLSHRKGEYNPKTARKQANSNTVKGTFVQKRRR